MFQGNISRLSLASLMASAKQVSSGFSTSLSSESPDTMSNLDSKARVRLLSVFLKEEVSKVNRRKVAKHFFIVVDELASQ